MEYRCNVFFLVKATVIAFLHGGLAGLRPTDRYTGEQLDRGFGWLGDKILSERVSVNSWTGYYERRLYCQGNILFAVQISFVVFSSWKCVNFTSNGILGCSSS